MRTLNWRVLMLVFSLVLSPIAGAQILLEDFDTWRNGPGGSKLWDKTVNGNQTVGLQTVDGDSRFYSRVTSASSDTDSWYVHFYPNTGVGGNRYPWPQGFAQNYILSGSWDPLVNHLTFWLKCDGSKGFSEWRSYNVGTYVKSKNDDPDWQGNHYYHYLHANIYPNKWIKNTITWTPGTRVGDSGTSEYPPDPHSNSFHYFDGMTRWYVELDEGLNSYPFTCWIDQVEFHRDANSPTDLVKTVTVTHNGSAYELSLNGKKNTPQQYEIRYSTSSMKANGFTSGTLAGTGGGMVWNPSGPSGSSAYAGLIWTSPSMAANANGMYFAVRPVGRSDFFETFYQTTPGEGSQPPPPQISSCDVNSSGSVDNTDYMLSINAALGSAPCSADLDQNGSCNAIDVQRIANAVAGGQCLVGSGS